MKSQIRHLVAEALYPTRSYSLPAVCERYGLEPGEPDEAHSKQAAVRNAAVGEAIGCKSIRGRKAGR